MGWTEVGHKVQSNPGDTFCPFCYSSLESHLVRKLQPGLSSATDNSRPESGPYTGQPAMVPAACGGGNIPKAEVGQDA